jgi:transcriptional regulator with XRE-family HTH domain
VKHLATNIRFLRKQSRKTQVELASLLDKRQTTIANWENGVSEPNLEELLIIINLFGISPNEMLLYDLETGKLMISIPEMEKLQKSNLISKGNGKVIGPNEGIKGGAIHLESNQETAFWYLLEQMKAMSTKLDEIQARIGKDASE